jgi:fructose-1,6-bisphosphatase/inositol monophosphatase family enzyme
MATAEWAVIVDPVDGTWNFAKGLSVFGMILAVLHRGVPVWGMLYDPVMDDWIAAGDGHAEMVTEAGRRVLRTSAEERVGRMNGYVTLGLFPKAQQARIVQEFPDFARVTSLRCACHEYRMLVQGHVEFCLSGPVPHPWDHAAGVLAVERAGGVARFLDGERYHAGRMKGVVLAAASQTVWDTMAERFAFLG